MMKTLQARQSELEGASNINIMQTLTKIRPCFDVCQSTTQCHLITTGSKGHGLIIQQKWHAATTVHLPLNKFTPTSSLGTSALP